MGILSDFEDRVGKTIEGVFSGMFKSSVQPAELARACTKEMEKSRKIGVGKVYVANVYSVLLSPKDDKVLSGLVATLEGELETYLLAYAREHDYHLSTHPIVRFMIDDDLKLGRFEAIGEMLSVAEIKSELGDIPGITDQSGEPDRAPRGPRTGSMVYLDDDFAPEGLSNFAAAAPLPIMTPPVARPYTPTGDFVASLQVPKLGEVPLRGKSEFVLGRLEQCDICIPDVNASRKHAMLEREGLGWSIVDLGATNQTLVNGDTVTRLRLVDGDRITIGITDLIYREKGGRA